MSNDNFVGDCGLCDASLGGQSDVARPTCSCQSYCHGCLLKSIFERMPSTFHCSECQIEVQSWKRFHRDMSSGNEPQERRRTTRLETIGGLSEIQRKLAIHPSARKYYAMDRETERMGAVHLQMTFQHTHSLLPTIVGVVLDENTGKSRLFMV